MTQAKTTTKRTGPVKLRAVQTLFYDNRIISEGEVYLYSGDVMPSEFVAVPAGDDAIVGSIDTGAAATGNVPPLWTTKGFVDRANRDAGRQEGASD